MYCFTRKLVLSCLFVLLLGGISISGFADASDSFHGGFNKAKVGSEPLPKANPSSLAKKASAYMQGRWRVVGSGVNGNKLFSGKMMLHQVGGKKYLSINYSAQQYASLDSKKIKTKSRKAFMVMYFHNNTFNLLSFMKSGVIKHYQGKISRKGKKYRFAVDPFKIGPIQGQIVFVIIPMNKDKYLEKFYMNILAPGSNKVMKEKLVANMVVTRMHKWYKKNKKK